LLCIVVFWLLWCITAGGIITGQQVFGRGTIDMLQHFNTM